MSRLGGASAVAPLVTDIPISSVEVMFLVIFSIGNKIGGSETLGKRSKRVGLTRQPFIFIFIYNYILNILNSITKTITHCVPNIYCLMSTLIF